MSKNNKCSGIVVALKANYLFVEINDQKLDVFTSEPSLKKARLLCTRRSKLDYQGLFIDVGDEVLLESIDWVNKTAAVSDLCPRKSFLKRPAIANVTLIAICVSVEQPLFDAEQASRFLITAEGANIKPLLVLTKIDLITKDNLDFYINRFKLWGYNCLGVSVKNRYGIELIIDQFRQTKLSVLAGPSGVGKTSLINYLIPTLSLPISSVSKKLKRGIHTTRHVELFSLGNGSLLADTPGFNRPDISVDPSSFAFLFPEFRAQLNNSQCKFRNCLHRDEPGCVINKDLERYPFYRNNIEEMINSRHLFQGD